MLPTPYTVTVRTPSDSGLDDYGNPTVTWSEDEWAVHSISPGAMEDPRKTNRDLSQIVWTVQGPRRGGYPRSPKCQIVLPGDDGGPYEVNEGIDDWTRGPWLNPIAGLIVELRRADG